MELSVAALTVAVVASAPVAQPEAVSWSVEQVSATSAPQAGVPSAPVGAVPVQPSPSPSQEQVPVTVQQPPGISGYVPVEYLLPLVGLILIFFAASRPGGRAAMKAVLGVLFGPGGGGTPPLGP
ncbi:hypothetical protein AB0G81_05920 [Streptomyces asoensis]|uniref:hypothetical protein n=1 Tax=Streptomyces asoensis TaxID=249586 RepID=UPI0033DB9BFA